MDGWRTGWFDSLRWSIPTSAGYPHCCAGCASEDRAISACAGRTGRWWDSTSVGSAGSGAMRIRLRLNLGPMRTLGLCLCLADGRGCSVRLGLTIARTKNRCGCRGCCAWSFGCGCSVVCGCVPCVACPTWCCEDVDAAARTAAGTGRVSPTCFRTLSGCRPHFIVLAAGFLPGTGEWLSGLFCCAPALLGPDLVFFGP